ncbi:MAG: SDR family oxidoreductase, partial [Alphaproteobacteria bacterium]|nr:SDR family oxidoreductase [Alphaproteobacteria bacterium]
DYFSYTLSKSACHTLTQIAAQAYAPRLRVNGIAPGIVLPSGGQTEEEFQLSHKRNLLGQGALMKEIVAAMHLLLDTRSITGEVIILDGGAHLQPPARDVAFL